ncbi:hypothetical protein GR160_16475 [Flavobacterium sp. Sd200]|uniref:hypothetical protein n=1 Tax=Flavobacterium sp. Sd200 TaxID=2692211 RepID=UPI00136809F5|nr:hypothetical protein [Flavobacterium sp. Sd200]MXN92824.1 hypothetical protein [Flavobacterium sp. Sd200]
MEPNKFEQDIKIKMEQRTIEPSGMAWDRLDAMLSVTEEKKKKPNRTWMYMAACFLALLLVGVLFLDQQKETTTNTNNSVVTTTTQPQVIDQEETTPAVVVPQTIKQQEAVAVTADTPERVANKKTNNTIAQKTIVKQQKNAPANTAVAAVNHTVPANQEIIVNTTESETTVPKVTPSKIRVDANSLLASVDARSSDKPASGNPVVINPKVQQPSVKVNANSLLSSVEGELDESFRSKVLNTVSKSYNKVKTSVATRNHQ